MESYDVSPAVSFRVAKDDFSEAVSWVARSLPTKATQPVLRAMLITATEDGLELAGFDYEVSTKVTVAAEVEQPGRIAVAGKLIADITATLPHKPVRVQVQESKVLVTCGPARFELPMIPLDDYPALPALPEVTGEVDARAFAEAVSQVAAAAGRDETLPMLTGVHLEIRGAKMHLTATDRFRLAVRTIDWTPRDPQVEAKLLVPAKTLLDNARTLDSAPGETLKIAVGTGEAIGREGLFGIHTADRETTTRMLDADFPNTEPLLPKRHTAMAVVPVAPLQEAIKRVSLVTDRNAQLRMQFSHGEVILSAGGTDSGHAEEALECEYVGPENMLIAFNHGYLKDGLGVIDTKRVVFGFTEPSRPAILIPEPNSLPEETPAGDFPTPLTDFTYLLMPVRLPG